MSLAPAFLVSMPQLTDPNFNRTVVLLCKHNDEGAFGLVVNRPLVTTGRVVVNLEPPVSTERELEVWLGGPVEPQSSWMLVGDDFEEAPSLGGMRIVEGLRLSTSRDRLRRLLHHILQRCPVHIEGHADAPLAAIVFDAVTILGQEDPRDL